MVIRYNGHSSFYIGGSHSVVTDPFDKIGYPFSSPKAEFCLSSHDHFDHNAVNKVGARTVCAFGSSAGGEEIELKAIPAFHDDAGGTKRGKNAVYEFTVDGVRFCHAGDIGEKITEDTGMKIGKVDVLMLPVGGVYTIGAREAVSLIEIVRPKIAIPMHYATKRSTVGVGSIDDFLALCPFEVKRVGREFEITKDEIDKLPSGKTVVMVADSSEM